MSIGPIFHHLWMIKVHHINQTCAGVVVVCNTGKFLNVDLAAVENINSCIVIKLWNKYIMRTKLLLAQTVAM